MILNQIKAAVLILGVVLAGCGGAAARQKALRADLNVLNTARDGFVVWDDQHQASIVEEAITYEAGTQALDDYHQRREPVLAGFEAAYRALAVAAFEANFENALKAYNEILVIYDLIKTLTGTAPLSDLPKPN
jgi:hypothetical protein